MRHRLSRSCLALLLVACGEHGVPSDDAGRDFDAALAEGGVAPGDAAASDAGAFIDGASPDGAAPSSVCRASGCDPREPSSCEDDAGVCALIDQRPSCVAALGDAQEGDECMGDGDCGPTLACFGDGSTVGRGTCARVCCPDARGACGDEREFECEPRVALASAVTTAWGRCAPVRACDVLNRRSCADGEGCYIETETATTPTRTVCRWAGAAGVGEPCTAARDCQAGLFCGGIASQTCVRVCSLLGQEPRCLEAEGRCVAQAYSPPDTGICVR